MLPFIINHSWSGILFHDRDHNIIYRDGPFVEGRKADRHLKQANLSIEMFNEEEDRTTKLFNANKVTFMSGDF